MSAFAQPFSRTAPGKLRALLALILLAAFALPAGAALNSQEQKLASLLTSASGQRRDRSKMVHDQRLSTVARARATDMARRRYFSHTNPDGKGANYLVRQAGFPLPSHYNTSSSGNNIESIGAGYSSASAAWSAWMDSSGHKTHLLATDSFYRDQVAYGVGYYYDASAPYDHYYVVLTAPMPPDVLSIATPASGAKVLAAAVTVTGTASGSAAVAQLQVRVENATGAGAWQGVSVPAGSIGGWTAQVSGLAVGANTLRARTLSPAGSVLRETTRAVRLVVVKPLTVSVVGAGKVTPGFLGVSNRELGAPVAIGAAPMAGMIFGHWEGLPSGDTFRAAQSFVMAEGLTLTAHFVPNPFPERTGSYQMVISGGTLGETGVVRLSVGAGGGVTGHIFLGGARHIVRGVFNSIGQATITIPRAGAAPLSLALSLDVENPATRITGTLADGASLIALDAVRGRAADPTAAVVRYTVSIEPDAATPNSPQGFGYVLATVGGGSTVRINGALADGRPIVTAAALAPDGSAAIYAPLFAGSGAIAGSVRLSADDATGGLRWFRPALPVAFASTNTLTGSPYTAPAIGTRAIALGTDGLGEMILAGGGIPSEIRQPLQLGVNQRAIAGSVRLGVNALTGRFSGSFAHPAGGTRIFSGVVLQKQNGAWGYFLSPGANGAAALIPADV